MDVEELVPGLWRWTGWHEEWKQEVGCVYYESADGVCLIDPLVPPEEPDRFLQALDRDIARIGGPVHLLVSVCWHARSARQLLDRYDARVWAPSRARAAVARRTGEVAHPFRPGDRLPGDVQALPTARGGEVVFWLPGPRTLVPGDAILGSDDGGLRLCPESWLPAGVGHAEARRALRPLLDLPVERVLVSHGEPVRAGGADALRAILSPRPPR